MWPVALVEEIKSGRKRKILLKNNREEDRTKNIIKGLFKTWTVVGMKLLSLWDFMALFVLEAASLVLQYETQTKASLS